MHSKSFFYACDQRHWVIIEGAYRYISAHKQAATLFTNMYIASDKKILGRRCAWHDARYTQKTCALCNRATVPGTDTNKRRHKHAAGLDCRAQTCVFPVSDFGCCHQRHVALRRNGNPAGQHHSGHTLTLVVALPAIALRCAASAAIEGCLLHY